MESRTAITLSESCRATIRTESWKAFAAAARARATESTRGLGAWIALSLCWAPASKVENKMSMEKRMRTNQGTNIFLTGHRAYKSKHTE